MIKLWLNWSKCHWFCWAENLIDSSVLFFFSSESNYHGWKSFETTTNDGESIFILPHTLPTIHLFCYIRYCTKTISKGKRASHEMRVGVPESWEKQLCGFGRGDYQPLFVHYVFNHYLRLIPHEFTFVMRQYTVWIIMWAVQWDTKSHQMIFFVHHTIKRFCWGWGSLTNQYFDE